LSCCYCRDSRLKDKVCIITGANQGIGFYVAKALARKGMQVIIGFRSKERGNLAAKQLSAYGKVSFIELDLASLESVRQFVKEFKSLELPLHCLVNNAGIMGMPYSKTKDGYEMHLGVNHLGHFALTLLLMDVLKSSAPSRVVTVSSSAHLMAGTIPFDRLPVYDPDHFDAMNAYSHSKSANVLFTYELQERLKGSGVTALAVHPGVIRSNLWQYLNPYVCCICKCTTDGAQPIIYAASSSSLIHGASDSSPMIQPARTSMTREKGENRYFVPTCCCTSEATTSTETYSRESQKKLWDLSVEWAGLKDQEEVLKHIKLPEKEESDAEFHPSLLQQMFSGFGSVPCCWCCC